MSPADFAPIAQSLRTMIQAGSSTGVDANGAGLDIHSTLVEQRGMLIVNLLQRQLGVDHLAGVRLIDVGCGFGGVALLLALHGAEVDGVDVKRSRIKVGARIATVHRLPARFHRARMEALPQPDASFDAAVLNNAFPYLVDRSLREQALREMLRVVRPGGALVARSANRLHPRDAFSGLPLVQLLPPELAVAAAARLGRARSTVRLTSRREALRELQRAGWTEARGVAPDGHRRPRLAGLARYHHVVARRAG